MNKSNKYINDNNNKNKLSVLYLQYLKVTQGAYQSLANFWVYRPGIPPTASWLRNSDINNQRLFDDVFPSDYY